MPRWCVISTARNRRRSIPACCGWSIAAQDISASELQAAYADMRALSQTMHAFHRDYDLLLTPTVPITAFAAGVDTPDATRFPQWFDWTPLTWPFNLTRQPAASVP